MTSNGPTYICTRIGQALQGETDTWFGPMDVANALARALEARGVTGLVISWHVINGCKITPDILPELAVALNRIAGQNGADGAVSAIAVKRALSGVLRGLFGVVGGQIVVSLTPGKNGKVAEVEITAARRQVGLMPERRAA